MARAKEFVLAGSSSQNCVRLRLTSQQLRELSLKLQVVPLGTGKKPLSNGAVTERRPHSACRTRRITRKKSPITQEIGHFGPQPAMKGLPKWHFRDDSCQKTPKFSIRSDTPVSQLDTEASEPLKSSRQHTLRTEIENLDQRIQQEIQYQDTENAQPLEPPSPLLLPVDLMTSYKQTMRDIVRMKSELELLRSKEAGIVALNLQLRDTLTLQQRKNGLLRTAKV